MTPPPFPENIKENAKQHKGFASMTPDERQRIARLGGIAAQKGGKAHRFLPGRKENVAEKAGGRRGRRSLTPRLDDEDGTVKGTSLLDY
jgi:hypothetical protein